MNSCMKQGKVWCNRCGIVLIIDDLLHGRRGLGQGFQLDLHHRNAIDEQNYVIAMVAIVVLMRSWLITSKVFFAPILDVDQSVVERRAVIPLETVPFAQGAGRHVYVWP